jgi:hypothetical protein
MAKPNFKIVTPHAAVIVWNYDDRGGRKGFDAVNEVEQTIISTVSCVSISTQKTKSNPQGSFNFVLAPYKDWISALTPGSWCCILMSQNPIAAEDFKKADPKKVKMIGKIDSVRIDTNIDSDGARKTQYVVTGVDWGYVFNNTIYIDNFLANPSDPKALGQGTAIAIQSMLFGKNGVPKSMDTSSNLRSLINIFGKPLNGFTQQGTDINLLGSAIYDFIIPKKMVEYFNFLGPNGKPTPSQKINHILTLFTGSLKAKDKYNNLSESVGFIDPYSLQGAHTFWQVLQENSNPAINEMVTDLRWEENGLRLALYNRIKPFSFSGYNPDAAKYQGLRSFFQLVKTIDIDDNDIISVNAGTNWNDKYNFIEIKPDFSSFQTFANWYKQKSQVKDQSAFSREGFRPLIVHTKQYPGYVNKTSVDVDSINWNAITAWSNLLAEWYFDTHRMLNGTITIIGQNQYIGVGDNIRFNADLINPNSNFSSSAVQNGTNNFLLAHVESVSNSFGVTPDGARQFVTTIQFVRGIFVNPKGEAIGQGTLDKHISSMQNGDTRNTKNVITTSGIDDPDPSKVKGR